MDMHRGLAFGLLFLAAIAIGAVLFTLGEPEAPSSNLMVPNEDVEHGATGGPVTLTALPDEPPVVGQETPAERLAMAEDDTPGPGRTEPLSKSHDERLFQAKYAYLRGAEDWQEQMQVAWKKVKKELRKELHRASAALHDDGAYVIYPFTYDDDGKLVEFADDPNIPAELHGRDYTRGIDDEFRIRVWFTAAHIGSGEHHLVTLDSAQHAEVYAKSREASWLLQSLGKKTW